MPAAAAMPPTIAMRPPVPVMRAVLRKENASNTSPARNKLPAVMRIASAASASMAPLLTKSRLCLPVEGRRISIAASFSSTFPIRPPSPRTSGAASLLIAIVPSLTKAIAALAPSSTSTPIPRLRSTGRSEGNHSLRSLLEMAARLWTTRSRAVPDPSLRTTAWTPVPPATSFMAMASALSIETLPALSA